MAKSTVVNPYTKYVYGFIAAATYVIGATAPDYSVKANVYYDIYDELNHRYYQYCYVRSYCVTQQWYEVDLHPYE